MAKNNSKTETRIINETLLQMQQLEDSFNLLKENVLYGQQLIEIGSWTYDIKKQEMYRSDGLYRILDCSHDDLEHNFTSFYNFVHTEDMEKVKEVDQTFLDGKEFNIEFKITTPKGELRYIHEVTKIIFDEDGTPSKVVGIMQDITETKMLEQKLKDSLKSLDLAQRLAHIGSWEINHIENYVYWSDEAYRIHGIKPGQYHNTFDTYFEKFVHPEDQEKILNILSCPTREATEMGYRIIREDNSIRHIHQRVEFIFDEAGHVQKIVGIIQDITEKRILQKELEHNKNHDEITGFPNSTYFNRYLEDLCNTGDDQDSFALMLFALDDFEHINDSLGFQMGHQLIALVAERLKVIFNETAFMCRYSDSLFAVIVKNEGSTDEYSKIANRIIVALSETFRIDIYELDISVSMGISVFPYDGQDPGLLLKNADIAKMRSRNEGKNLFRFFSRELGKESQREYALRRDLFYALDKNELKVLYQPMFSLETNQILAVEALVRWQHPVWGEVKPIEFIHLAEESGFIINIGKWTLREVCKSYKKWTEAGMPKIKVSINFSGIQFFENDFAYKVKNIIDEFGLDYSFLVMEITESVVMKRTDKVRSDIKKLQALGVKLALDDFGTGFSSLSYISIFNIDILKIDASFLHNLTPNSPNSAIIRLIAEMASRLDIQVVAEGIETAEQLNEIKKLNCAIGQGFIFSKPKPEEELIKELGNKGIRSR